MNSLKNDAKKAERIEEIAGILFKEELGYVLDELDLLKHLPVHKRLRAKKHSKPAPERLRETFEQLGTVFIKFGQILSERPDLIPEEYCRELSKLQDSVPAFNPERAKKIVDEEVGLEKFEDFEEEPLAAASIAQVHRGTLNSGEKAVVKIRRPEIKEKVERDLDILVSLAERVDKHFDWDSFAENEVREFAEWTREEMDFRMEKRNMEAFKENMEGEEKVRVPEVFDEFCTEKVLVMEYIDAVKCDNVEEIRGMDIDEKEIARTGIRSVLKQILRDGLLHADPHPSNFMVDREGNLVFLDFGMMTRITEETQRELGMMMIQISNEDIDGLMETMQRLSRVEDDADLEELRRELEREILKLRNSPIKDHSISKVLVELSTTAAEAGVYLPTKITLIGKGILTMEGIGMKIYPDFQLQNEFQDEVEELLLKQNRPENMAKEFAFNLIQNQDLITKLPEKINKNLEPGIQGEHRHEHTVESPNIPVLPGILSLSSTALIAGSVFQQQLLYIGLGELLVGLYLYWSRD